MAKLVHHGTAIRFICDQLWQSVFHEIGVVQGERVERLQRAIVPVIPGASIVLGCSYVERLVCDLEKQVLHSGAMESKSVPTVGNLRKHQAHFGLDLTWDGWAELGNFFRLRHCFAHEFGRLTDRQRVEVKEFLADLVAGSVVDAGEQVKPYFIVEGDELVMLAGWNDRLRRRLVGFLRLFEKHGFELVK